MKNFRDMEPADFVRIPWRRKWYILITFFLVSGGVAYFAKMMPNFYKSESRISVDSNSIPFDYVRPSDTSAPDARMMAIRDQLMSRTFLQTLIEKSEKPDTGEKPLFGYSSASAERFPWEDIFVMIGKSLAVVNTSRNVVSISFVYTDPGTAHDFTYQAVHKLIEDNEKARQRMANVAAAFVDGQLDQVKTLLDKQEQDIMQFKMDHRGELPEQSIANINTLNGLEAQRAAVENALQHARDQLQLLDYRAQEQHRLGILTRNLTLPGPVSPATGEVRPASPSVLAPLLATKQAELAALSAKYMPAHPDVIRLTKEVEDLKARIAQAAAEATKSAPAEELTPLSEGGKKAEAAQSKSSQSIGADTMLAVEDAEIKLQQESIKSEIAKREKERQEILANIRNIQEKQSHAPELEQQLMLRYRDRDVLKQQYDSLKAKTFQAAMTKNLETNRTDVSEFNDTYRILDEASRPDKAAFPNRRQIAIMGVGAALLLGFGVAFGREYLDNTLGSEEEVAAALSLPVLVSISEIPAKEPRRLLGPGRAA